MGKSLIVFFCCIATLFFNGCSGSNGGGGVVGAGPKNQEEALSKLSPAQKQNFEDWKQRVVKACDASDAFGLSKARKLETDGIDGAALIKSNNGSVIFSDHGSLAIMTSYSSFSGIGTTKVEESHQVNGQGDAITAETKREGSQCSVYLFGQKVFETYITESFVIGSQWNAGKEAQSTSGVPQIRTLGTSGAGEVVQQGVYSLLAQTLKPSKEAIALISKKLGLNEEQTSRLFKLSTYTSAESAIRIENEASAIWSNQEGGNLIAQSDVLKKAFDGIARTLPLEVRLGVPNFTFGETKNSADVGNLKLAVDVSISKKDSTFVYSTQTVEIQGLAAFDKNEGTECSRSRANAYSRSSVGSNQIQPSVQVMFSPCRTLYSDIEAASYESGLMKSLIPQMFVGVSPSPKFQYGEWDLVLSKLALEDLEQDKSIRNELDPSSRTLIVGIVADHLETLKQEMNRTKNMGQSKGYVFQMGLDWSFRGQVVSASRIGQILQAIDNSVDIFKVSSEKLLADLGHQSNISDDQLSFAQTIDGTYKVEAMKALALSKDLSFSDFERDVFNQVIQRKISVEELKDWSTKFSGIRSEINKYSSIGPVKGDLVGLSIKWLKSGKAILQDLEAIYAAIDNSFIPFENSAKELVRALSQSLTNYKEALDFARSISPEYKRLATAIRDNSKAADFESWGQLFFESVLQKKPSIEQVRAWNETWTAGLAFTQREKARTKDELGSTNEWNRKTVVETAVKETWSSADFAALETLAEVARAKNNCDRYQGYSSLADCCGMRLFSKQKGMFLDPIFGGRYVTLGRDFASYMVQLSSFDWTTLRWAMIGEFFGSFEPIWSKCDQNTFNQKSANLKNQVNAIARETDQFKKWELERQIKDTVRNCSPE